MFRLTFALCVFSGVLFAEGEPTPEALGKQFDAQVARLVERGYPAIFGDRAIFDKEMAKLREEAVKYVPAKPGYAFLVVAPEEYAPLLWQIRQIILPSGERCATNDHCFTKRKYDRFMDNGDFTTPNVPYLIYDVDVGDDTRGTWVGNAGYMRDGRRGLTVTECAAFLVQYPETLSGKKIAATGTTVDYRPTYGNPYGQFIGWKLGSYPPHNPFTEATRCTEYNDPNKSWIAKDFQFPSCREDHPKRATVLAKPREENETPTIPVRDESCGRYWPLDELRKVYAAQVGKLRARGYAALFGEDPLMWLISGYLPNGDWMFPESLYVTLAKDAPVWVDAGNIPLLIVIPEGYAPYAWQARRAEIGGVMNNVPDFDLSRVEHPGVETPPYPYLIYNVSTGTDTARISIDGAERDLKRSCRRGLTFAEGVALLTHYPDAMHCEEDMDENYRKHFSLGRLVFLEARCGPACKCDRTIDEYATFVVRKGAVLSRGNFIPVIRRDMRPNYARFLFPSCDPYAPKTK